MISAKKQVSALAILMYVLSDLPTAYGEIRVLLIV